MRRLLLGLTLLVLTAAHATAGARDYFTEFDKDFGPTPRGPVLTHYFTIKNNTKNTITLGTARVSCGCVSAYVLKSSLAPDESTACVAYMDTRRIPIAGIVKSVIVYVPFLSPTLEEVTLTVKSIARDDLLFSSDTLALGTVKKGKSNSVTTKVTLYNHPNWEISSLESNGKFVLGSFKQVNKTATEVSYDVTAKLDENCPAGNWTSELFVKTNTPGLEKIRIPVTVNVVTPIAVSPERLNIVDLKVDGSVSYNVTVQGSQNFKIVEVKGDDDEVKVKTDGSVARTAHTIQVEVKPKKEGDLKRDFEIVTDHPDMPKFKIPFEAKVKK
jgi:hypothetical protein